jgi:hypothetical protein
MPAKAAKAAKLPANLSNFSNFRSVDTPEQAPAHPSQASGPSTLSLAVLENAAVYQWVDFETLPACL